MLYRKPNGRTYWSKRCQTCIKARARARSNKGKIYQDYKGDYCVECGFIPQHKCQLDVDHINGDGTDHRPENLQTLCANCHRLKTYDQRHLYKEQSKDYYEMQMELFNGS